MGDRCRPRASARRRIRAGWTLTVALCTAAVALACGCAHAWASSLPDGRAYELVSPNVPDGVAAAQSGAVVLNDDEILYGGGATLLGPSPSGATPWYLAQRTPSGWVPTALNPPVLASDQDTTLTQANASGNALVFSLGPAVAIGASPAALPQEGLEEVDGAGQWSTIVRDANPATDPSDPSIATPSNASGISADGDTIGYSSAATPAGLAPDQYDGTTMYKPYVWTPGGSRRLQSASGDPLADCDALVAGGSGPSSNATNAVSSTGQTVFVQSDPAFSSDQGSQCPAASEVYVNRGGANVQISTPTDGSPAIAPSQELGSYFAGATPDGTTAYFISADPLTANAPSASQGGGESLYQWSDPPGGAPTVTCLTCDATNPNDNAGVYAAQVTSSGQYVYFVAEGVLGGEGQPGEDGLFVYHDGRVQLVDQNADPYLLDLSTTDATGDVIVYDVQIPTGGDSLWRAVVGDDGVSTTCISCDASGTPQPASLSLLGSTVAAGYPSEGSAVGDGVSGLTADGDTVAFSSTGDLAPGAVAGVTQVYRWTAGEGDALVASNQPSGGAAITSDGSNIVFFSSDALTPGLSSVSTSRLFDARVGGGFPATAGSSAATSCVATGCQGPAPTPVSAPSVGSDRHSSGNLRPGRPPALALRPPSGPALRSLARTGRLTLRVGVRGAGTLRARLHASLGRGAVTVASARRRIRGRQPHMRYVTLTLRLSGAAQRRLGMAGRLKVTETATLGAATPRHLTFTLTTGASR